MRSAVSLILAFTHNVDVHISAIVHSANFHYEMNWFQASVTYRNKPFSNYKHNCLADSKTMHSILNSVSIRRSNQAKRYSDVVPTVLLLTLNHRCVCFSASRVQLVLRVQRD
jgi:hypothetical protein